MNKNKFKIYIAGFFDGEGSISMKNKDDKNTKGEYGINVGLSNAEVEPLKIVQKYY